MKEPIAKDLYDVLVCADCKARLRYTNDMNGLICEKCKTIYAIEEGIPILLPKDIKR